MYPKTWAVIPAKITDSGLSEITWKKNTKGSLQCQLNQKLWT